MHTQRNDDDEVQLSHPPINGICSPVTFCHFYCYWASFYTQQHCYAYDAIALCPFLSLSDGQ